MFEGIAAPVSRGSRAIVLPLVALALIACSSAGAPASSGGAGASVPAAAGGGAVGAVVKAGDDLCKLLGPGDFAAIGIADASGPSENNDPPTAYFCVYRGKSSATGGIELDVFVSETAAEAHDVFPEAFSEFGTSDDVAVSIAGADEATLSLPTFDGSTDPALIGVRKGTVTILIGVGTKFADAKQAGEQLKQLAALALQRASALGG